MKEKLNIETATDILAKIGKLIYAIASYVYTFVEGSIIPGIIAFMIKFWFGGMKPDNADELPTIADSPKSVWAFLGVMGLMGTVNTLLQKFYIIPRTQHVNKAKDNTHRLEHMRLEIQRCIDALQKENEALATFTPQQKLMLKILTNLAENLIKNSNSESLNPEQIKSLVTKFQKNDFNNSFSTTFLQLHHIDINKQYLKPQLVNLFIPELEHVKKDTRAAKNYMFNGVKGWLAIGGITSFATVANFGVPVVFAMTIHALLQDFFALPYGEDIIYTVITLAFVSCIYHGYTTGKNLLNQKKTENNLLTLNANLFNECNIALGEIMEALKTNSNSKKEIRKLLSLSENMQKEPYAFEFKLYQDVKMQDPNTLAHRLLADKKEQKEEKEEKENSLLINSDRSNHEYGTREYEIIPLSSV